MEGKVQRSILNTFLFNTLKMKMLLKRGELERGQALAFLIWGGGGREVGRGQDPLGDSLNPLPTTHFLAKQSINTVL